MGLLEELSTDFCPVASDQYGNYLVQWILQHASIQHREQVASHIRKHMVSLRGSKFGSRVGMLCCNPIYNRQVQGPPSPTTRFNRFVFRLPNILARLHMLMPDLDRRKVLTGRQQA